MIPTVESPDVHGHTVFCEDIRQEAGGKVSLMGVYRGAIHVHTTFPATLPRLAFAISLIQRKSIFKEKVTLRIFLPGDSEDKPSVEVPISGPGPDSDPRPELIAGDLPFILMQADIQLGNLVLPSPGIIKVRAFRDEKLYPLGSLAVIQGAISGDAKVVADSTQSDSEKRP